jgi:hypothetical protein
MWWWRRYRQNPLLGLRLNPLADTLPHVPKRPSALAHVSDETASIVLARHFGDFVKAARELDVKRTDLRKLTWHNPRILNAAHQRMDLFRIGVRSKILEAVWSRSAKRRRWGFDAMFDSYEFRDQSAAYALLSPAPRQRAKAPEVSNAQLVLAREAAAELERERAVEIDGERRREQEGEAIVADIEPSVDLRKPLSAPAPTGSLWPAWIKRPTRGQRWR